jgi:hypothetical protein
MPTESQHEHECKYESRWSEVLQGQGQVKIIQTIIIMLLLAILGWMFTSPLSNGQAVDRAIEPTRQRVSALEKGRVEDQRLLTETLQTISTDIGEIKGELKNLKK